MYNQGNIRLHVDLFIKYVSNNVYADNNHGQPQSILNIFLTFFSSLYFMTTFCGLFSVWYWYHCFFLLGGMKMSGSKGLFNKKKFFFTSSGAVDGKHKKKYGHPYQRLLQKLQRIQNIAARLITGCQKFDHITPIWTALASGKGADPMGDFGILHVMSLVFYLARGECRT